jgi:hypothetical protein
MEGDGVGDSETEERVGWSRGDIVGNVGQDKLEWAGVG